MKIEICNDSLRVVVLDISGLYTQIYDEIYCTRDKLEGIRNKYNNTMLWRVIVLEG